MTEFEAFWLGVNTERKARNSSPVLFGEVRLMFADAKENGGNPVASAFAQASREAMPGFDPTCALCQSGEEPEHEH